MKKYLLMLLMLPGCSYISYDAANGETHVSSFELGSTTALSGASFETKSDGTRKLKIKELNKDRVQGLEEINQGLALILEGLAKGAISGAAP